MRGARLALAAFALAVGAHTAHAALFDDDQPFPPGVPQGAWSWESIGSPSSERIPFSPGQVPVAWVQTQARTANAEDFLDTVLPKLRSYGTPENVRVVFWFS